MRIILLIVSLFMVASCERPVSFSRDVKPILDANCLSCHDGSGEGSAKSDFVITDYNGVMNGTKYGSVVIAGSSVSSTLYRVISHKAGTKIQMPPHHDTALAEGRGEPLQPKEIEFIKNWIDQGALDN